MTLIDTHTHLYATEFENDIIDVIKNAITDGVHHFYLPAIDSSTHNAMMLLENKYPDNCFAMMGLHPCSVKENYITELNIVQDWLTKKKFKAIGEIGLDFYWDNTFANEQIIAFKQQIDLAIQYHLPIVIHTRKAMEQTIDIIKQYKNKNIKGVFHCFGGTYNDAIEIINLGFYLGIGGVVTYKNAGLAQVVEKIDLKHIVLETDAPYLTPMPYRGKRNESSYLKYIANKIAAIKNISIEEVALITSENAKKLFY